MKVNMTKILLVEDDKSLREIYGVRLLAEGYDIVSAGDGEEALAMAIKERPQLIVSDVMMPKISGFDMLDILRSTTETKAIKVIMMTALSSEDQRARGEALGADRYLVKSQVGIEDVVRTVHDVLGDNLIVPPTAQQSFGTPTPSAVARPVMTIEARPQPTVLQPAAMPQPVAPPTPAQPQPVINNPPAVAEPPQPSLNQPETASSLPQPTAPFSSARPASLGDRVIHPLTNQPPAVNIGNLMNQELSGPTVPQPVIPPPPPALPPVPPTPTVPTMPNVGPIQPGQSQTLV